MAAQLTVVAGPPGSGKTEHLLAGYRDALSNLPPGSALWLAPTWRAAAEVRALLVAGPAKACFAPGVMTFGKFADTVLESSAAIIRPMTPLMTERLIRGLIDQLSEQGRLRHFGPIAQTAGLVGLVGDFIRELKRLEIWPEHFRRACEARGITDKDLELLEIYEAYQQALRENNLYDAEGRFWSVRDWLSKRFAEDATPSEGPRRRFPEQVRVVVADGFTDLTRTQHEILQLLARRAETIDFSLTLEGEPRRKDLFAKPLKTLAELRRRHPGSRDVELTRPEKPAWPALAHVERHLFENPRGSVPAEDTNGLEILAAARERGALELVAAQIKRLLTEKQSQPDEIAVVFRSPQGPDAAVAEVLAEYGIPFVVESGLSLTKSPAMKALLTLLRLDLEDWPAEQLRAILRSNYFSPAWEAWQGEKSVAAAERSIRRAQIAHGREKLLAALKTAEGGCSTLLDGCPAADEDGEPVLGSAERDRLDAAGTLAVLERLFVVLAELPQRATLSGWFEAWKKLVQETGLAKVILKRPGEQATDAAGQTHPASVTSHDAKAWQRLQAAIEEDRRLNAWLQAAETELDRAGAMAALGEILDSESVGHGDDESGRVRVLSAASARALKIPHLFFAGLSEKSFPVPDREDRLYGEAEYLRLIDEGLPLVARSERSREEMLLFYETIHRATRRLVFSYPSLDDSGQPLSSSPYLKDVEQACGAGRIARTELGDLSPVPCGDEPLTEAEHRILAMAQTIEGNVGLLAGLYSAVPEMGKRLLAGLQFAEQRQDRKVFGPSEGMLFSHAARSVVAGAYPAQRTFTATELERYATCPFRFFLERIAKIEPLEDMELQIDFLERGSLIHAAMALFHRRVNAEAGHAASPCELSAEDTARLWRETLDEVLPIGDGKSIQSALREVDRRVLSDWIAGYAVQVEKYEKLWKDLPQPMRPEFFEVAFGRGHGEGPPSTAEPFVITWGKETVKLSGRIDRIDTGQAGGKTVFNILDYKTGGTAKFDDDALAAGSSLQLPIYALAAAELLLNDRDGVPWQAGYWVLSDDGFKAKQALKMYRCNEAGKLELEENWEDRRAVLEQTVVALANRLRNAEFPVYNRDEDCTGRCVYRTVCRINHIRSLEKTWAPTPVEHHGE